MECLLCYLFGLAPKFQPMEESAKANEMRNPIHYGMFISDLQSFLSKGASIKFLSDMYSKFTSINEFYQIKIGCSICYTQGTTYAMYSKQFLILLI